MLNSNHSKFPKIRLYHVGFKSSVSTDHYYFLGLWATAFEKKERKKGQTERHKQNTSRGEKSLRYENSWRAKT